MNTFDRAMMQASAGPRLDLIAESFARLTGERLLDDGQELWFIPRAVVAHGTGTPPVFFYANKAALEAFALPARRFIGMPSEISAPDAERKERAAMLARLDESDVVHGYSGIRVAADGTRFRISDAVIWNLVDIDGERHGQAAAFAEWETV